MKFSGSHTWFLMDLKDKTVIGNILFEQWQVKKNNSKYNVESRYDSILVYIYIQCICWEGEKINEQIAILSNYKENSKA